MAGVSDSIEFGAGRGLGRAAIRRISALLRDPSERGSARRFAALAFVARVVNAGLGFGTQILLARWMGDRQYGIYAYLWVWLLVGGGVGSLGLPVAAMKLVPDYSARGDLAGLRGFLGTVRGLALAPSAGAALVAGALVASLATGEAAPYMAPALLALVVLPLYVLADIQTGVARAYDFADLGLAADYLLRPVLLLLFTGLVYLAGAGGTAANVMAATLAAMALTTIVQGALLFRRIGTRLPAGPSRLEYRRWANLSWPLLTVTAFTLLLGSTDILVLKLFVGPEDIALYFAATKIVAIASFVSYGVSNTSAHRFAAHMATQDRSALSALAADTVRWTFWPTLGAVCGLVALGGPLLTLFGPQFAAAYPVLLILGLGLVAGASVGPADRALAMGDHGRITALIYAGAFAANLALAIALTPIFGLAGAAAATAFAMAGRALLLFVATRQRLGLDMFIMPLGRAASTATDRSVPGEVSAELLSPAEAGRIAPEWQDLADRALEPNTFYGPAMTLAGLRHLDEGQGGRVLAAWRGAGENRRLVGLVPLIAPRGRQFNPLPLLRAAEFYGTLSTPLLDPHRPEDTMRAMLGALDRSGIRGLALPFLRQDGPVAAVVTGLCQEFGFKRVGVETHQRPMLERGIAGAEFARVTIDSKRRRKLERQRRRLADEGPLEFRIAASEADVLSDLEGFLALESSGWKGRLGTSLAHATGAGDYIREVAREMARGGRFRVATLALNGRPIAAGLVAIAGSRAFYLKIAYDEAYAKLSPGILLTLDLSCRLLDDPDITETDSLAVPDHPLYKGLWLARMTIGSELISTRSGGGLLFDAAVAFERMRDTVRLRSKPLREKAIARLKRKRTGPDNAPAPEDGE